jgi:hypothetical protein
MFVSRPVFGDEVTFPVSLDPSDWDTSQPHSAGAGVYNEDGALVLEVLSGAEFAWQGICYYVIDLDLGAYPNGRVTTSSESTAAWGVKLYTPELPDQTHALGGDLDTYGQREFVVGDITGQSGVSSFELWLWAIGHDCKVIFTQLEFFGEGAGLVQSKEEVCVVYARKGEIVFNSVSDKPVFIYSVTGTLVQQFNAKTTPVINVQSGLYFVKVGAAVIKVLVP